jgi:hypothetical protein
MAVAGAARARRTHARNGRLLCFVDTIPPCTTPEGSATFGYVSFIGKLPNGVAGVLGDVADSGSSGGVVEPPSAALPFTLRFFTVEASWPVARGVSQDMLECWQESRGEQGSNKQIKHLG